MKKKNTATPEMRKLAVEVANDVISQVGVERYALTKAVFVDNIPVPASCIPGKGSDVKTKTIDIGGLLGHVKKCRACAIGCAFLSLARIRPGLMAPIESGEAVISVSQIVNSLHGVFAAEQVELIEEAFMTPGPLLKQKGDMKKRLLRIMENVIQNDGEFIPPDGFIYKPPPRASEEQDCPDQPSSEDEDVEQE